MVNPIMESTMLPLKKHNLFQDCAFYFIMKNLFSNYSTSKIVFFDKLSELRKIVLLISKWLKPLGTPLWC